MQVQSLLLRPGQAGQVVAGAVQQAQLVAQRTEGLGGRGETPSIRPSSTYPSRAVSGARSSCATSPSSRVRPGLSVGRRGPGGAVAVAHPGTAIPGERHRRGLARRGTERSTTANCARKSYRSLYRRSGSRSKTSTTDAGIRAAATVSSRSPFVIEPEGNLVPASCMMARLSASSTRIRFTGRRPDNRRRSRQPGWLANRRGRPARTHETARRHRIWDQRRSFEHSQLPEANARHHHPCDSPPSTIRSIARGHPSGRTMILAAGSRFEPDEQLTKLTNRRSPRPAGQGPERTP